MDKDGKLAFKLNPTETVAQRKNFKIRQMMAFSLNKTEAVAQRIGYLKYYWSMEAVSELMDMVLSLFSFKEKNSMAQRSFF